MSAPATDLRRHYNVALGLLNTALSPVVAYRFGEVPGADGNPGTLPDRYALVDIQRRYYRPTKMSARAHRSGWAVTVVGVGRNVDEAAWVLNRATDALEGIRLAFDPLESTPVTHERSDPIQLKDGLFEGRISWTYAL